MSTLHFGPAVLALVVKYLDISVADAVTFSTANAKAYNERYAHMIDWTKGEHASPANQTTIEAIADALPPADKLTFQEAREFVRAVRLFRYNTDDFESECADVLTRIEAAAFHFAIEHMIS